MSKAGELSEIERADEAACKLDGMFRDIFNQQERHDILAVVIAAVDAARSEEKRKNCRHYRKLGTGSLGSDGSSSYRWSCSECGSTGGYDTPAGRAALPTPDTGRVHLTTEQSSTPIGHPSARDAST